MRILISFSALLATLLVMSVAVAHSGSGRAIHARLDGEITLVVSASASKVGEGIGLGTAVDDDEVEARADAIAAWLVAGLHLDVAEGRCTSTLDEPQLLDREGAIVVSVEQHFACPGLAPGLATGLATGPIIGLSLTDDTMIDAEPEHASIVTMNGNDTSRVLRGGAPTVALAPVPWWSTAWTFMLQGGIHLVTGYDHLLFVLSLLFAAGLLAQREGFRTALRDVSLVVTAFTVGHSATLVMASLGVIVLSSRLVESVIAASIIVVALLNVVRPDTTVGRPWLALAFGLVHGFGFSSVLAEVGLPKGQHVMALLSFNVGIEIAQLIFVALVLGPLTWLASKRFYKLAVMQLGSAAIAMLAGVWLVERALG